MTSLLISNLLSSFLIANKVECAFLNSKSFLLLIGIPWSEKIKILEKLRNTNGRSIPTLLSDEMDLNLFLKADNNEVARALGMEDANALDVFTRLRSLKDNF